MKSEIESESKSKSEIENRKINLTVKAIMSEVTSPDIFLGDACTEI